MRRPQKRRPTTRARCPPLLMGPMPRAVPQPTESSGTPWPPCFECTSSLLICPQQHAASSIGSATARRAKVSASRGARSGTTRVPGPCVMQARGSWQTLHAAGCVACYAWLAMRGLLACYAPSLRRPCVNKDGGRTAKRACLRVRSTPGQADCIDCTQCTWWARGQRASSLSCCKGRGACTAPHVPREARCGLVRERHGDGRALLKVLLEGGLEGFHLAQIPAPCTLRKTLARGRRVGGVAPARSTWHMSTMMVPAA